LAIELILEQIGEFAFAGIGLNVAVGEGSEDGVLFVAELVGAFGRILPVLSGVRWTLPPSV